MAAAAGTSRCGLPHAKQFADAIERFRPRSERCTPGAALPTVAPYPPTRLMRAAEGWPCMAWSESSVASEVGGVYPVSRVRQDGSRTVIGNMTVRDMLDHPDARCLYMMNAALGEEAGTEGWIASGLRDWPKWSVAPSVGLLPQLTMFMAPAASTGVDVEMHVDDHDSVLLVITGCKKVRVAPPWLPAKEAASHTCSALTLAQGDMLAIPAGTPHAVQTEAGGSIALSWQRPRPPQNHLLPCPFSGCKGVMTRDELSSHICVFQDPLVLQHVSRLQRRAIDAEAKATALQLKLQPVLHRRHRAASPATAQLSAKRQRKHSSKPGACASATGLKLTQAKTQGTPHQLLQ